MMENHGIQASKDLLIHLGDNGMINGQRLAEWCGHGPVLEQDIALTNIALDHIGRTRLLYSYAAELIGGECTEDTLMNFRDSSEFRNLLLLELPRGDFAFTIARQFFFDTYNLLYYQSLCKSEDKRLAAIAEKSLKEIAYHFRYSSEWMQRLGDGTEESAERLRNAIELVWRYTGELFIDSDFDRENAEKGISVLPSSLHESWESRVRDIFDKSRLQFPEERWMERGGKDGKHTEHLGYILAELQFVQRAYPGLEW